LINFVEKETGERFSSLEDMKFDWVTSKIYWSTGRTGKLYAMSIDDQNQHISLIARGDWINAIALHPCKGGCIYYFWLKFSQLPIDFAGKLFWSDSGFKMRGGSYEPRIEMAAMSGNRRNVLVNRDVSLVIALTIDYQADLLYWADANRMRVERCDLQVYNNFYFFILFGFP